MQPWFRFVLAALAVWRLAFLVAREEGPWRVVARVRAAVGRGPLAGGLSCVKCVGLWLAAPFAFFVGGTWPELFVTWLALAGVAALIDEWARPPFEWREQERERLLPESDRRPD